MSDMSSRRSFLTKGAALGAGAATALSGKNADAAPKTDGKLKIGVIGLGKYSFMLWSWSDIIESTSPGSPRGNFGTGFLNMDITHVWDLDKKAAEEFAGRMDAKVVKNFDDMIGKIDGLILADFGDVAYQHLIAKPYLEAGIPCYISRPFAYSLRDVDTLLEAAAKNNTPICATAKYEHYKEVPGLKQKIKNVGNIKLVQASACTYDFPIHFHIQFMMLQILGLDVKQVSMFCDNPMQASYVHETYLYEGKEGQSPYICTIDGARLPDSFDITVFGDKANASANFLRDYDMEDSWEYRLYYRYAPQILDMQRTFEGRNYEPYDNVRKKTEIFLTAYYSYIERGGAPVDVGTVPMDWRVTPPHIYQNTDKFPG